MADDLRTVKILISGIFTKALFIYFAGYTAGAFGKFWPCLLFF
jgi:hypothetical protein